MCAHTGSWGHDMLDRGEVATSHYVCNPTKVSEQSVWNMDQCPTLKNLEQVSGYSQRKKRVHKVAIVIHNDSMSVQTFT